MPLQTKRLCMSYIGDNDNFKNENLLMEEDVIISHLFDKPKRISF